MHLKKQPPNIGLKLGQRFVPNANKLTITQPWPNVSMIFGLKFKKEPRLKSSRSLPSRPVYRHVYPCSS